MHAAWKSRSADDVVKYEREAAGGNQIVVYAATTARHDRLQQPLWHVCRKDKRSSLDNMEARKHLKSIGNSCIWNSGANVSTYDGIVDALNVMTSKGRLFPD